MTKELNTGEPAAYACKIIEADFETNILKIEMLDENYKVSAGVKYLSDTHLSTNVLRSSMNKDFAKIYIHPEVGQVLVQRDYDDVHEQPVLKHIFWNEKKGKTTTVIMGYENSEDGISYRDKAFDSWNEDKVNAIIKLPVGTDIVFARAARGEQA